MKPSLQSIAEGKEESATVSAKPAYAKRILQSLKDNDPEALQIALDAYLDAHMDDLEGPDSEA